VPKAQPQPQESISTAVAKTRLDQIYREKYHPEYRSLADQLKGGSPDDR
jgi:hypothetical protein